MIKYHYVYTFTSINNHDIIGIYLYKYAFEYIRITSPYVNIYVMN